MNPDDWQALVPEVELRQVQFEALGRIWSEFEGGAEVVLLEAPTGVGKSIIQLALGRKFAEGGGSSYMVTPQRALQDQMRGWDGTHIMKGRSQYDCRISDGTAASAPCTVSPDVRLRQPECAIGSCPFYTALDEAIKSSMVVHNYSSLMAQSIIGGHFGQRDLLSLDEGHTAAGWVRNFMTFEFTRRELHELTSERPPEDSSIFIKWFVELIGMMNDAGSLNGLSDDLKITVIRAKACKGSFASVPWSVVRDHQADSWTIIPLRVSPIAWTLTNLGRKLLITSATILHRRLLIAELGLGKKTTAMVGIPSAFPPENRPIIRRFVGSMSKKARDKTMPAMIREICRIADHHRNEPGIIHTVSHALAEEVCNELSAYDQHRYIVQLPQGGKRDQTIRDFLSGALGPSTILIGPSLMEGIDGKDDACRWQIMCKAPYPNMGDPVVADILSGDAEAMKWGRAWYAWKTAQQSVQGFGRVCRTPTDHGTTYLLDSGFARVLNSGYIPGYVLDAIR